MPAVTGFCLQARGLGGRLQGEPGEERLHTGFVVRGTMGPKANTCRKRFEVVVSNFRLKAKVELVAKAGL